REAKYIWVHQIGFRKSDDAPPDSEQAANVEMLARLWLDGLVSRDHQKNGIDSGGPSEHVLHEPLVSRNIDERNIAEMRKSEIDRNAAPLFFFKAIGVDASEGSN